MVPIKVIIAEDDSSMRIVLRKILEDIEGVAVTAEVEDGRTLIEKVEEQPPDVVFLDVDMPGMDGLDASREIADLQPKVFIIFATAYPQYTRQAFEVYAFDYLVKPFKPDRIRKTMERIKGLLLERKRVAVTEPSQRPEHQDTTKKKLMVQYRRHKVFVNLADIVLITREARKTVVYTVDKKFKISESLGELEEKLDGSMFIRCHQSFIVNLDMITEIIPWGQKSYLVKLSYIEEDAIATMDKVRLIEERLSTV